jgi:hypothetical protein
MTFICAKTFIGEVPGDFSDIGPPFGLFLRDGAHRALTGTGTAGNAGIGVDDIVFLALRNRVHGANRSAGAAGNTLVADYISHIANLRISALSGRYSRQYCNICARKCNENLHPH